MKGFFKDWRQKTLIMRDIARPDVIKGVTVQIKEFKQKLNLFDKALEKLHADKLSKLQYQQERRDPTVAQALNDITSLYDTAIDNL